MHTVNFMRRIGEPPARVPHRKTSHRDVLLPPPALCFSGITCPAGREPGLCPGTPPPFEKGGRKHFVQYFPQTTFSTVCNAPAECQKHPAGALFTFYRQATQAMSTYFTVVSAEQICYDKMYVYFSAFNKQIRLRRGMPRPG